jgi:hypothetical protein
VSTDARLRHLDAPERLRLPQLRTVSSEVLAPLLPEAVGGSIRRWRTRDGRIAIYGYSGAGARWLHLPGLATFRFTDSDEVTAIAAGTVEPERIQDAYRRTVLPLALQVFGLEVLHASAVVSGRGVAAFCAHPETGKSTVAYGLGRRGYPLWADDAVVFRALAGQVQAIPLPFRIRLRPLSRSYFAGQGESEEPETVGQSGRHPVPLAAVFVLERVHDGGEAPVEVHRLSAGGALPAVLTHAHSFSEDDPARKRRLVDQYLALVAGVPVFQLRFPPGLERLGDILDQVERTIA